MRSWLENFLAHRPLLFRIIGRFVRPDEIEDIVQETFLHSYAASRKQQINNPRAFMVRTAKNIALNHISRAAQRLNQSMDDSNEEELDILTTSLEQQYASDEKFLAFCQAVAELPVHCRKVFILKKVYGLSQKEIAAQLDISESTVEKHVAKGLLLTAESMLRRGQLVQVVEKSVSKVKRKVVE